MVVEPIVEPRLRRETSKFCFFPLSLTFPIVAEMIFFKCKDQWHSNFKYSK